MKCFMAYADIHGLMRWFMKWWYGTVNPCLQWLGILLICIFLTPPICLTVFLFSTICTEPISLTSIFYGVFCLFGVFLWHARQRIQQKKTLWRTLEKGRLSNRIAILRMKRGQDKLQFSWFVFLFACFLPTYYTGWVCCSRSHWSTW